jgi:outer membrane protein TolC
VRTRNSLRSRKTYGYLGAKVDQATKALSISTMLYDDGLDNYLSVAVARVQALTAQTAEVQILTRQMQGLVSLIRALGGGWTVRALPDGPTLPFGPTSLGSPSDPAP